MAYPRVWRVSKFFMVQFFCGQQAELDGHNVIVSQSGEGWVELTECQVAFPSGGNPWSRSLLRFRLRRSPEFCLSFGNLIGCRIQLRLKTPRVSGRISCMN